MANNNSRSANFSRNALFAAMFELSTAVLSFVVRLVFVRCLNAEYLGIGGLFTNILTILSLAELGAGSAIVYSMYKPLAEGDHEKIKSLIGLYKKLYLTIGTAVLMLGLTFIPFIDFFIKERPNIPYQEFILIYILTVIQTASTYFFSYRYSIFSANQQGYIVQRVNIIGSIIRSVIQIVILLVSQNYVLYLLVAIGVTFGTNIVLSQKADKSYSYLREKAVPLDKESVVTIKKNILAMLLYKLGIVTATTIDTLLMSKYFGIIAVGIYSNYHLIITYSDKFFSSVMGTVTPSLGNLMVTASEEKKMEVFSALQLIYYWLASYLAVGLIILFNPFIKFAFGSDYLFEKPMVIALVVSITLTNFQRPCSLTRDATGLFWYGKLRPLAMAFLNIVFSVISVHYFGIIGVVIGTILSKLFTYVWYDPYIVFKHVLKGSLTRYYFNYLWHWGLIVILTIISQLLYDALPLNGICGLLVGGVLVTVIVNGGYYLLYHRSASWKYLMEIVKPICQKLLKRK